MLKKFWRYPDRTPAERLRDSLDADYREILAVDLIIWLFLLASIPQIAYVLGRGEYTVISVLKALGIDGAVWLLSRAVAKRTANRFSSVETPAGDRGGAGSSGVTGSSGAADSSGVFWTRVMLWSGIVIFLILTTAMNTAFEFWEPTGIEGVIAYSVPRDRAVVYTHLMSSSFLAVIILFLSFTRTLLAKNFEQSYEDFQRLSGADGGFLHPTHAVVADFAATEVNTLARMAAEPADSPDFPAPRWPGDTEGTGDTGTHETPGSPEARKSSANNPSTYQPPVQRRRF